MRKPAVLLADDHKIVLEGLRTLLGTEFEVTGTAENGRELVEMARSLRPDVIVTDISMPLLNGIEAIRQLRDEGVQAKVVFLTMYPDAVYASRAREAGASGYIIKHSASDELVAAIHAALRGEVYISEQLRSASMEEREAKGGVAALELTPRQREVLQLLAEGKSSKEIGAILQISARTVETHKYKMMDDLGLKSSAQLVQHAIRHGLV